jgi:hypothetical protein
MFRQSVGQNRDEDQIVDAKDDLHCNQGRQSGPRCRFGRELEQGIHVMNVSVRTILERELAWTGI